MKGAALTVIVTRRVGINVGAADKPTVRGPNSLITVLGRLRPNSILFVSRVRQLPGAIRRVLCSTVRSCFVSVIINRKPTTRPVRFPLPPFALVNTAAQTKILSTPLQSHFNVVRRVTCCDRTRLRGVVFQSTGVFTVPVRPANTHRLTVHSENAPQVTGQLLGQIHSFTRITNYSTVSTIAIGGTLGLLRISRHNLSRVSHHVLRAVVSCCRNNPMNLGAVTTGINRRVKAVRRVCRPCLLRVNFVTHAPEKQITAPTTCHRLKITLPDS